MSASKAVAVIGLGNIGRAVATNFVRGNRPVIVASKELEEAQLLAGQLGNLATATETREAIKQADIILFTVWFSTLQELLSEYRAELQGKIIIDPSNPITIDETGSFVKLIGEDESAGQIISQLLPEGARLVKAWSTLAAATLANEAFKNPDPVVLFYTTDDFNINGDIEQLIRDNGYEPVRVGGIEKSRRIEVFGDLVEFSLGKTLTVTEATEKI